MGIIKAIRYFLMTIFNCMSLQKFRQLAESYAEGNVSVGDVLIAYIATNSLTKKHFGCTAELETDWKEYLNGSKLEVISQIGTRKIWNLFAASVNGRKLSAPEQFILINIMPVDAFCKMYGHCVKNERITWFDNNAAKMLVLDYRQNYNKLQWYVQHCRLTAPVLSLLTELFMAEAIELEKTNKQEPACSICNVFRQWLAAENAPNESFKSYETMLDFALFKQENLRREAEAYVRLLSSDLNYINAQY